MNMTKLNIEILTNADYLHFGSLKIVGFDNLTFRFDSSGKLMADFWDDRDGYHEMREDEAEGSLGRADRGDGTIQKDLQTSAPAITVREQPDLKDHEPQI